MSFFGFGAELNACLIFFLDPVNKGQMTTTSTVVHSTPDLRCNFVISCCSWVICSAMSSIRLFVLRLAVLLDFREVGIMG